MKKKSAKTAEPIEVATFKLAKGCSADDFIAANAEVDEWLKQQPGFRSRRIAVREDGTIVDMLPLEERVEKLDKLRHSFQFGFRFLLPIGETVLLDEFRAVRKFNLRRPNTRLSFVHRSISSFIRCRAPNIQTIRGCRQDCGTD
jgi:hypothetical protein